MRLSDFESIKLDPPITFSPYAGGSKRVLLIADVNNGEFLRFDYQGSWLYCYLVKYIRVQINLQNSISKIM